MTAQREERIPHSRPRFAEEEVQAVAEVLRSGHIAQGARVEELEVEWARQTGTSAAAAVASGTSALRLTLLALGVGHGDEVIVPAYSCVAILNAVLATGAAPVLTDIIRDEWTIDPQSVKRTPRTKAIIAVHLFGMPARIAELTASDAAVVEDCAHGIGGEVDGRPFGGAGAASIASFYATKMIPAGEGGIVASNNARVIDYVRNARNGSDQMPQPHLLNDKMTDIEAAIALVQVRRLRQNLARRAELATRYAALLAPLASRELLVLPPFTAGRIWYRFAVRLSRHSALEVARSLQAVGIDADTPVWDLRPVVAWRDDLAVSAEALDRVLSLPLYPDLTNNEQDRVVTALTDALTKGS